MNPLYDTLNKPNIVTQAENSYNPSIYIDLFGRIYKGINAQDSRLFDFHMLDFWSFLVCPIISLQLSWVT